MFYAHHYHHSVVVGQIPLHGLVCVVGCGDTAVVYHHCRFWVKEIQLHLFILEIALYLSYTLQ